MGYEKLTEFLASLPPALERDKGADMPSVVKAIREQCNAAIAFGVLPEGTKLSVRCIHYNSVKVEIAAWTGGIFKDAYVEHLLDPKTPFETGFHDNAETLVSGQHGERYGHREYLLPVNEAIHALHVIANRHNYDKSDSQADYFNVGYYLNVSAGAAESAQRAAIQLESNPVYAEKLSRAKIAAKALGPKCTKSVCGRRGIDGCPEWALDTLLRVAERANGRTVAYDKSRHGWFPVSSAATVADGSLVAEVA